jgi:branched-chain amino acid transport system substrate-binding protein
MKKKRIVLSLWLVGAFILGACATPTPEPAPPTEPPAAQPTAAPVEQPTEAAPVEPAAAECPLPGKLKIGMIQPISGPAATVANRIVAGATLATEEINAAGGILGCEVELIVEDSQADAAVAVSAAEKLINQDQVAVIIGAYHSSSTLAVMPVIAEAQVPLFEVIATSPLITDENNGWVFRISSTNAVDAKTAVTKCFDDLALDKWAFLPVNNDWGKSVPAAFQPVVEGLGGSVVLDEPLEQGGTNFLSQLTKVRNSGADTVAATIDIESLSVLAKQAYEAGMTDQFKWIATSGQNPEQMMMLLADTPQAAEGWYFISYYAPTYLAAGDFPFNQEFTQKFTARFPDLPAEYASAEGYQGVQIVSQAIERAGVYDGPAIRDALKLTDYAGLTGHLTFDEKGQAYPNVYFQQIVNGEYTSVPCQ